jgi:UDP-N-acetylglucosamine--dolichyl-phosphate N-acetylglucosaminephosphotransferase
MGIVPSTIYLILTIIGIYYTKHFIPDLLLPHISALLGIIFIILLGFADDVLELAWRYKLFLPIIATLPVIVAYTGVTTVVVPVLLRDLLGRTIELGFLYYVYMVMLAIF